MAKRAEDLICTVVASEDPAILGERASRVYTRFVELRLDMLNYPLHRWVERRASQLIRELHESGVKVVATLREKREGGRYSGNVEEKLATMSKLAEAGVDYVDVELDFPLVEEVSEEVRRFGAKVIVSYHDFEGFRRAYVDEVLVKGLGLGDIVKIITTAGSVVDNIEALEIVRERPGRVISFCMGPLGLMSRILAPLFGAPFTYAHHDDEDAVAPGQISASEAVRIMKVLMDLGWKP